MAMAISRQLFGRIHFGDFDLDLQTAELRNGERRIVLAGKPFEVLKTLLERPGELVSREELINRLWSDGTFVDFEQSLNKAVNRLREALDDSADHPTLIETLPRKGYRFIGQLSNPVTELSIHSSSAPLTFPENGIAGELRNTPTALPATQKNIRRFGFNIWRMIVLVLSGAVGLTAVVWLVNTQSRHDWIQLSPLTDSGQVYDLALSPDGRFLAYASEARDASQPGELASLRLREIETQKDVELLPAGPGFHGLTFSTDGGRIYLLRADPNDPFFKILYSMPAAGGPIQKLISDVDSPVSFSPDGREFVYEHCLQPRNDIELIISDIDGVAKHHLATLHDVSGYLYQPGPAWSPDGKTIAVPALSTTGRQAWILYAISATDGSVRNIISSSDAFGRPIWIDRGTVILSHFDRGSRTNQFSTVSVSAGIARQVTHGPGDYLDTLSATRDHQTLAGITLRRTADVWSMRARDLQDARQLTHSGIPIFDVAEAFDGKLLALDWDGVPWIMVADGSQWTKFAGIEKAASITPCGRFVVFVIDDPEMRSLVRFDRDGTHGTTLARGHLEKPVCAVDGGSVFYVTTQQPQTIWRVPLDRGEPQKVVEVLGNQITDRLAVSPDGKYLAYPFTQYGHVPSDGWHMAIVPVAGGSPVSTRPITTDIVDLHWSPMGTGFQYIRSTGGAANIWEEPISGGPPRQLTNFNSGQAYRFNWTTDKQNLLITRGETAREAVLFRKSIER
jgi:DNA-binding winged helix-turn-helix (wHTH) protein/Tol biopolymer transport system component